MPLQPLEQYPVLRKSLTAVQVIVAALVLGVAVFIGILLVWRRGEAPQEPQLTWLLVGVGAADVVVLFLVRLMVLGRARQRIADGTWKPPGKAAQGYQDLLEAGDAGRLVVAWVTATILTAAGMEGAALLGCVAYLLEGQPAALVAAGFFGLLLALQMPTRGRLDQWLESELLRLRSPKEE